MKYELSQKFYFDAAHQLSTVVDAMQNKVIHGHTYHAQIFLIGEPKLESGMVIDMGIVRLHVENIHMILDHKLLNEIPKLEVPTLENLCLFIKSFFDDSGIELSKVSVWRSGIGDCCSILVK